MFIPLLSGAEQMPSEGTVSEPATSLSNQASAGKWTPGEVRQLRMDLGLSQSDFGKRLKVSRSTVSEWENGKGEISDLSLAALDRAKASMSANDAVPQGTLPAKVAESPARYASEPRLRLAGRAAEIEALMAYALQRQRELREALDTEDALPIRPDAAADRAEQASKVVAAVKGSPRTPADDQRPRRKQG